MTPERATLLATTIVVGTGVLWGFYWLAVRELNGLGLPGAWGNVGDNTSGGGPVGAHGFGSQAWDLARG